ncbi:inclusion body protein [Ruminiclostridium hungatei]|uniref:Inclusion body protein n=1 Tax=Ruminiclostridium hungatei TaxID=48256 RepID=A0A1V4SL54_RUMHU|nr:AidA/PixA family protein [Ruminiclostridium hungatei]OPX44216.1 inclusion body protein [Ruminiclostridium hungatei]
MTINELQAQVRAQTKIIITVDTARVISGDTRNIYMIDNRVEFGSTNEGTLELSTKCFTGDYISWLAVPLDPDTQDTVSIAGFQVSSGNVFGGEGSPQPQSDDDTYWMGRAINQGSQTYQVKIIINGTHVVTWDPFITSC